MSESYHCPKCVATLSDGYYEGECPKCGVDLNDYKLRFGRDFGPSHTLGDFIEGMGDLIDSDASTDKVVDFIDKEFLFGAWGHRVGMDILFMCDLRGALVAAYKCGKNRSAS
jgi:hypothetical protein